MFRFFVHYGIHFLVPVAIAFLFFKKDQRKILFILWAGILIDVDHLLATPIFDPERCSIDFHPLHTYWAMGLYFVLLLYKKTRLFGFAFLLHMLADAVDCYLLFFDSK